MPGIASNTKGTSHSKDSSLEVLDGLEPNILGLVFIRWLADSHNNRVDVVLRQVVEVINTRNTIGDDRSGDSIGTPKGVRRQQLGKRGRFIKVTDGNIGRSRRTSHGGGRKR